MSSSRYLWSPKRLLGLKYNFKIKLILPNNLLPTFRKYGLLKSYEELGMCFTLGVDTNLLIIINRIPTLEGAANPAKIPRHLLRKGYWECGVPFHCLFALIFIEGEKEKIL